MRNGTQRNKDKWNLSLSYAFSLSFSPFLLSLLSLLSPLSFSPLSSLLYYYSLSLNTDMDEFLLRNTKFATYVQSWQRQYLLQGKGKALNKKKLFRVPEWCGKLAKGYWTMTTATAATTAATTTATTTTAATTTATTTAGNNNSDSDSSNNNNRQLWSNFLRPSIMDGAYS